jgi:RNA polymerase sigma-70 factor (ECF subfamily)
LSVTAQNKRHPQQGCERVEDLDEDGTWRLSDAEGKAVGRAIERHDRMLVRWLAQKFGDIETARDIAQSAYLRVWRYAQTQQIDNLQALIFKTAANLAANEFRARKRIQSLKVEPSPTARDNPIEHIASDQPSPETAAVTREEIAASLRAINSLPPQARRAFILSRFEEKTYREIAVILGVSESSIEKYIIAALKALRAAAEESGRAPNVVHLPNRRTRR